MKLRNALFLTSILLLLGCTRSDTAGNTTEQTGTGTPTPTTNQAGAPSTDPGAGSANPNQGATSPTATVPGTVTTLPATEKDRQARAVSTPPTTATGQGLDTTKSGNKAGSTQAK